MEDRDIDERHSTRGFAADHHGLDGSRKDRRVEAREMGLMQPEYVARVARLNALLHRARLEDFCVNTESRSLGDVALDVFLTAEWLPG
jgi:hypothetical protein